MTSGFMWNQIRHPPYVQMAQGGQVNYIAGGYSNQVGAETHILAVVCKCTCLHLLATRRIKLTVRGH